MNYLSNSKNHKKRKLFFVFETVYGRPGLFAYLLTRGDDIEYQKGRRFGTDKSTENKLLLENISPTTP